MGATGPGIPLAPATGQSIGPPRRAPARVVAADWSGAAVGEARHLWLAEADPGTGRLVGLAGHRRREAVDRLVSLADHDSRLLVGLDFGFSFPRWWLAECGLAGATQLWADEARLEGWLTTCPPPFWGRPGRRRPTLAPDQEWRRTELAVRPRPKSIFQIGGAGAVGTGSLRGMPFLDTLRRAGFHIWPFDPPGWPMVAEVWPRLFALAVKKSRLDARQEWVHDHGAAVPDRWSATVAASADAFDATVAALGLLGMTDIPEVADPVAHQEGWILGVPLIPSSHAE